MPRQERKHSLATRSFHWINVPVLAVMIWSGLLIYWANDVYEIRFGGITLVKFFPGWFYRALHVDHRLAEGMAWHFTFMWFFAINVLLYVTSTFREGAFMPPTKLILSLALFGSLVSLPTRARILGQEPAKPAPEFKRLREFKAVHERQRLDLDRRAIAELTTLATRTDGAGPGLCRARLSLGTSVTRRIPI